MAASPRKTRSADAARIAALEAEVARLSQANADLRAALAAKAAAPRPEAQPPAQDADGFYRRLRAVRQALGTSGGALKIQAVKTSCRDIPPAQIDTWLIQLQHDERIVLYSYTSPAEMAPGEERYATVVAGQPRHIIFSKTA
ncbi:MAG: hypothetical protein LBQ12_13715 [Deltaproteobacteria bacterium]|jgi:hypothetical protein|nr:hypothetical protein [Deltaproteobacteria bacterium]